ncbi:nuclear transcription factor Y subunit C-4-like [Phoenix dactylifera]|uniref:Nuclear transcription factor Y subunit C-4-like n=1 Tax=Phoenix dactylifera TaxID=42345 RepID=A0A8B9AP12_PHODC|nr:nuclear transcription factor Y subunit C-4-like [Phoenix dactylifera]XP_038988506.1 nuclear transcription factor Y subunit C-4-like [Phoenix dactylifera]
MVQSAQPSQPLMGLVTCTAQTAYAAPYQSAAMVPGAPAVIGAISPGMQLTSTFPTNPHQLAYQQIQQLHQQQQLQQHPQLQAFWAMQMADIEETNDFKNHSLPLSRIKKIMKSDGDVKMISAEAPMIFAKACEMFILELTLRSWNHTEENKRRTLQKNDVAAAISQTDIFDFFVDVIPRNELKEEGSRIASAALPVICAQADYHVPPQHQVTGTEMILGKPVDQTSTAAM